MGKAKRKKKTELRAGDIQIDDVLLRALLINGEANKQTAKEIPALTGCLNYIAGTISMIPIKLYKEEYTEDGKRKVTEIQEDTRIKLLNDETKDTLDAVQFWRAFVTDYFLGKGGYAYIGKRRNTFTGLYYVDEENISIAKNTDPIYKDYQIMVNGTSYRPYEFLKILRNTRDGCRGVSIIEENPTIINVGYNTLRFENTLVKKGGNKRGFLESERELSQEAIDMLRDAWTKLYGNSEENIMVLNKGLKFQEASNTSVEMQLNENKITNAAEICKLLNVPGRIVSGEATADDYIIGFKLAVMPLIRTIECALNKDFLLEKEKKNHYWAFDTKEITKGDIRTRYEAYRTAIEANFMQVDEVRYMEDMEPLDLNFIKLGLNDVLYYPETGDIYTPNTNQLAQRTNSGLQQTGLRGMMNLRAKGNQHHDKKTGRFTGGRGGKISAKEHARLTHQFATDFPDALTGTVREYENRNHKYSVEVHGFENYTFSGKKKIK